MVTRRIPSPLNKDFEQLVQATLEKWHVPGMSVSVVEGDYTWAEGYGIASMPSTPVTPSTLFYAGSTTKAFTGAMMGMLVEDNDTYPQVQWDTPVSQLIRDDFVLSDEYATQHITIEDILSHRSGLPPHDQAYGHHLSRGVAVREIVRQIRHLPLTAQPRTRFQYCNLMFVVASHVIETLTGKWLGDSLAQRIWTPLDMNATFFSLEDAQHAKEHLAHGYAYSPGHGGSDENGYREVGWMSVDEVSGAGSVITNVLDYAKWARSLMRKTPPLSKQVHKAIWEPRTLIPGSEEEEKKQPYTGPMAYALGWSTGVYQGYQFYEHTGGMNAFGAELILFPDLQYSVALLANTASTSNFAAKKIAFHLIDEKLGVPVEQRFDWDRYYTTHLEKLKEKAENSVQYLYPSLPSPTLPATLPLSAYAGTYYHPGYQTVTVYLDESNVLRADRSFITFPQYLSFEHVSGEYFLVRSVHDWDYGTLFPTVYAAEFRLGADGRASELGIGWEEEMKGEKLCVAAEPFTPVMNPSELARLKTVNSSKPQLTHSNSKQSVAASDDYFSLHSDQSSTKSSNSKVTVVRYTTPQSHLPSHSSSAQHSSANLAKPQSQSRSAEDMKKARPASSAAAAAATATTPAHARRHTESYNRPATSNSVRFGATQVSEISPARHIQDPRQHISGTTPGVDDSPYLRFAIDQLTRDEEVAGVGRHGSVVSADYSVERIVPDENLGYYYRSGPTTVEIGKPASRQGSSNSAGTEKQGAKAVFVAVEPGVNDARHPPLDFVPVVLRPWALAIYIFLVLWMIAGVVFSNVWSQRHDGIWDWDGVGTSRYFVAQFLPQLLAGLIVLWNLVLQAAIYRVMPFCIMASERQKAGALQNLPILARNHLLPDFAHFRYGEPLVAVGLLAMWLTDFFTMPLISCLFQAKYYTINDQGTWRWTTSQVVGWVVVGLYALLVIALGLVMARFVRSWTGLLWDPISHADLIPLIQRSNILRDFEGSETSVSVRDMLPLRTLRLGYWRLMDKEDIFYGIGEEYASGDMPAPASPTRNEKRPVTRSDPVFEDLEQQSFLRNESFERTLHSPFIRFRWTTWFLRDFAIIAWIIIVLGLFIAFVVVSFVHEAISQGFLPLVPTLASANGFSASNFLFSFIPGLIGNFLFLAWQPIDVYMRALQPFAAMSSPEGAIAERSLLLSYPACLPFEVTFLAFVAKHYKVAYISLMSLLFLAIPILSGGVFIALWYPVQSEVRIAADLPAFYVLVAFCGLYALSYLVIWPRRHRYLPHDVSTLADLISFLYQSPLLYDQVLREPRTKTDLVTRLVVTPPTERTQPLYGFGIYKGLDWKDHLGVDRFTRAGRADMLSPFASDQVDTSPDLNHYRRSLSRHLAQSTSPVSSTSAASCQSSQLVDSVPEDMLNDTKITVVVNFDASSSMLQDVEVCIFWYAVFEFLRLEVLLSKHDVAFGLIVFNSVVEESWTGHKHNMSWLLRRWLNPSTEENSQPVPTTTTAAAATASVGDSQTPTLQQQQQTQNKPPRLIPNNLKLLLGGLVFFSLSSLVTRRTLIRKHLAGVPSFYTSSVYHKPHVNGALDAFEALNLATINTFAAAMILAGGTLCVLDIDSVDAARARLRKRLGYSSSLEGGGGAGVPPTKEEEEQFERDMEAWLENVLGKKDLKEVRRRVEAAKAAREEQEK
ncbi:hypothetical protein UA08_01859 [Talaromyces atroroseus]|uniref:Beta-lactamase-related domain-containing protein n=1 Tax=Talaromyces atroroseus TaxID=1441469 RepID=A0A1Q5QAI8_TALAT|nr:hypothetical protein UA08_01859 [Talaromyces atroroseus]OKL62779.1 hypothetical protein UA08_01859 [Talaromyces atroroseus]